VRLAATLDDLRDVVPAEKLGEPGEQDDVPDAGVSIECRSRRTISS
jgi:hypothetical protein